MTPVRLVGFFRCAFDEGWGTRANGYAGGGRSSPLRFVPLIAGVLLQVSFCWFGLFVEQRWRALSLLQDYGGITLSIVSVFALAFVVGLAVLAYVRRRAWMPSRWAAAACALALIGFWGHTLTPTRTSSASSAAVVHSGSPVPTGHWRPRPVAVVIGDSYADGAGADEAGYARQTAATAMAASGYVDRVGRLTGLTVIAEASPGNGYVAGGGGKGAFPASVAINTPVASKADILIFQLGQEDLGRRPARVAVAAGSLFRRARARAMHARIVVVGVLWPMTTPPRSLTRTRRAIENAALATPGVSYVDTSDWRFPAAADGVHPTAAGHRYIARHLAAALRALGVVAR